MHLARWLPAAALLAVLAAPLPACRKYVRPPVDAGPLAGIGGSGGTGGRGGVGGSNDSSNPPPVDANGQDPNDSRVTDRPGDASLVEAGEACGAPDQKCCPGNRCNSNGCCTDGTCTAAFDMCKGVAASCLTTTCGSICGGLRESCCQGADGGYCARELTVCLRTDAGARCETCGNTGELCCNGNYCEPPNRACMNGRCVTTM